MEVRVMHTEYPSASRRAYVLFATFRVCTFSVRPYLCVYRTGVRPPVSGVEDHLPFAVGILRFCAGREGSGGEKKCGEHGCQHHRPRSHRN